MARVGKKDAAPVGVIDVTARTERDGKWWIIEVDVPGMRAVHSQARRLGQVEAMAREAVALTFGWPEDRITVEVDIVHPRADEVATARALRSEADALNARAAAAMRSVAHRLAEDGLTRDEIAQVLQISKSRAQQLVA